LGKGEGNKKEGEEDVEVKNCFLEDYRKLPGCSLEDVRQREGNSKSGTIG